MCWPLTQPAIHVNVCACGVGSGVLLMDNFLFKKSCFMAVSLNRTASKLRRLDCILS